MSRSIGCIFLARILIQILLSWLRSEIGHHFALSSVSFPVKTGYNCLAQSSWHLTSFRNFCVKFKKILFQYVDKSFIEFCWKSSISGKLMIFKRCYYFHYFIQCYIFFFTVPSYFIFDFSRRVFWSLNFPDFAFPLRVFCMHFEFCRFRNDIKIRSVAFAWSEIKIRIRTVTLTIFLGLRFVSELEILGSKLSLKFEGFEHCFSELSF